MTLGEYVAQIFAVLPVTARDVSILAGGALRAFHDGTTVKDYDLFFRNWEDACEARDTLELAGFTKGESAGRALTFVSPCGMIFNLVPFAFGEPADHVGRFDFRACQMAAWMAGDEVRLLVLEGAAEDAKARVLTLVNNNGTERTFVRAMHYEVDYGDTAVVDADEPDDPNGDSLTPPGTTEMLQREARLRRHIARRPVTTYGHGS